MQYTDVHVSGKKIPKVYIILFIKGARIKLDKMNAIHIKLQAFKKKDILKMCNITPDNVAVSSLQYGGRTDIYVSRLLNNYTINGS